MLRICRAPRTAKPVANYAPRVNQCRPGGHWIEDHGPNLALRAMGPPQVCGPQAQDGRIADRLEISAEVLAAHQRIYDRHRACACALRALELLALLFHLC